MSNLVNVTAMLMWATDNGMITLEEFVEYKFKASEAIEELLSEEDE